MEVGERSGACQWWGGDVVPPPLEIGKKDAVRRNFNLFHLCFTNEIRGESIHYTCKMEGWADRRVSIVEGGKGGLAPPRNGKKDVVRRNFNLFHLCFTNEIRGDRHTLHTCKMEGGGRTGACPWWEGVGARGLAPPPKK